MKKGIFYFLIFGLIFIFSSHLLAQDPGSPDTLGVGKDGGL